MAYEVLARKWRPRNFSEVVGQQHVLQVLTQAFQNDRIHHAYLFTGTRGVGKTTLARIIAKCLNCERGISDQPCGECSTCQSIDAGNYQDLVEVDAASQTKVEQMRDLLSDTSYVPTQGRRKTYLIDEVHMLSSHSFNALLKTLEEPPAHVQFLLATTDPQKIPMTVLSRCLQFHLKRLTGQQISEHLSYILEQEGVKFEAEAVAALARGADGSMRDGLSLLDQAINYCIGGLTQEAVSRMLGLLPEQNFSALIEALASKDLDAILQAVQTLQDHAPSFQDILDDLASTFHLCALTAAGIQGAVPEEKQAWVTALNEAYSPADIQLGYQILLQGRRDLLYAPDERTGLEMTLLRLVCFMPEATAEAIREQAPPAKSQTTPTKKSSDVASAKPKVPVELAADMNWNGLIPQLDFRGSARLLAKNCALERVDGLALYLVCDKTHPINPDDRTKLAKVLSQHFGQDVELHIHSGDLEEETPVRKEIRELKEQASQAELDMQETPVSRALRDELLAKQINFQPNGQEPKSAPSPKSSD